MASNEGMSAEQQAALKRNLVLVQDLLALSFVQKHETRFDGEVALVAPTSNQAEVSAVVERYLPAAVKAAGKPTPPELAAGSLCKAMGGIRANQTLFVKDVGGGLSLYVAYWPWGSGQRFTIKIGVHTESA
jgi:hypothetical protein